VIEEGLISADDGIEQVERPRHGWAVERVFQLLIGGMHRIDGAKAALRELADMEVLAVNWRGRARQLLESLPD
jgi:MOSC domain-containing protein YiiM